MGREPACAFAVDVPMRETSIFLLLLLGPQLYRQLKPGELGRG